MNHELIIRQISPLGDPATQSMTSSLLEKCGCTQMPSSNDVASNETLWERVLSLLVVGASVLGGSTVLLIQALHYYFTDFHRGAKRGLTAIMTRRTTDLNSSVFQSSEMTLSPRQLIALPHARNYSCDLLRWTMDQAALRRSRRTKRALQRLTNKLDNPEGQSKEVSCRFRTAVFQQARDDLGSCARSD